jgi:hypothetical protein
VLGRTKSGTLTNPASSPRTGALSSRSPCRP